MPPGVLKQGTGTSQEAACGTVSVVSLGASPLFQRTAIGQVAVEPQPRTGDQADPGLSEVPAGRRSARATMATFLEAVDQANQGQIERYADALACLDLSGLAELPEEARRGRARELASALNDFIDRQGIDLQRIPDEEVGEPFAYFTTSDGRAVQIEWFEGLGWLFTWGSLELVESPPAEAAAPKLTAEAQQPAPAKAPQAETAPGEAAAQVPIEFRSPRATMRTFRDAMREGRLDDAAKCLDLSTIPLVARAERGADLADYLYQSISRTREIVLQEFPDEPEGKPYVLEDKLGIMAMARQGPGDAQAGRWLFTKETVAGIESLYDRLLAAGTQVKGEPEVVATPFRPSRWLREHVPDSLKHTSFLMMHYQWLGLLITLLLGWVAHRITAGLLRLIARVWLRQRQVTVDEGVQVKTFRPLGILAMSAVWWLGLTWLALPAGVLAVLLIVVKLVACWAAVWTAYRAVDLLADYFSSIAAKTDTKMDDMLVPFVRKAAKVLVTVLGIVFIVQQFTEEAPLQLLAGLGLGGLALALAAQDALKNLFGSLTVMLDRPFKVGDWVVVGEFDGTVESVGFRSTRIRTFYNSQVVVPNASLMNALVDNYGARRYRRIKIMLSMVYSTPPEKIDAFCEGIRELIRLHPYTRKDYYHVYLNQFAASSLDVLLYCFLDTPDWSTELRERHRLFIDILRLAHELGVEFAFPTQTVWVSRSAAGGAPGVRLPEDAEADPDTVGLAHAAKVFEEVYGPSPARRGPVVVETYPKSKQRQEPKPD